VPTGLKHRLVHAAQKYAVNPAVRALLNAGVGVPGTTLLETTGRRSGVPRRTPVSDGLEPGTDTFWIIAEHGSRAGYVHNIAADPRVRVKVGGRWRSGTAHALPDDDPLARRTSLPWLNALAVRLAGTELLSIRIDLDPLR
jgi:deazaflavin-dependent oxidoreductase (nitroreductase family)